MKSSSSFALTTLTGAILIAASSSTFAAADVQANVEIDNTYSKGSAVGDAAEGLTQGGRVELNVAGKAGDSAFVAGRASLIAGKAGAVTTDDMWVQLGNATGDIKMGRFEGVDLFPLNGDTLVNHAGDVYNTNTLRGRVGGGAFHAAGTVNLGKVASVEIGLINATQTDLATVGAKGVRAVLSLGMGAFSARMGVESGEYDPDTGKAANKVQGFGLTATYDAGSFKVTGNYANGKQDAADNNGKSAMGFSVGVGSFGAGFVSATNEQAKGDTKVTTLYAAYSMPLFGVKGASLTPAFSTSSAKDSVANTTKDRNDIRVRIHYDF